MREEVEAMRLVLIAFPWASGFQESLGLPTQDARERTT